MSGDSLITVNLNLRVLHNYCLYHKQGPLVGISSIVAVRFPDQLSSNLSYVTPLKYYTWLEIKSQDGTPRTAFQIFRNSVMGRRDTFSRDSHFHHTLLILFYLGRHCFPNQKKRKTVNKTMFVLLKRFLALGGS